MKKREKLKKVFLIGLSKPEYPGMGSFYRANNTSPTYSTATEKDSKGKPDEQTDLEASPSNLPIPKNE